MLLFIVYQGGFYLLLAVFLLMVLGLYEFRNIIKKSHCQALSFPLWISALLFPLIYLLKYNYIIPLLFFYLIFCYFSYLRNYPQYSPLDLSFTLLGVIYVTCGFFHLILLRQMTDGFWLIIYLFIIVWSTDTGAYFIGTFFGKHQLAPAISPKKTWEGFLGGLFTGIIAAYLFSISVSSLSLVEGRILLYIAPLVSIAGQMGDLFESTLKRFAQIKDSSQIIPGHGGILDRFDSTLLAAPLTYYLFNILERLL